MHELHSMHEQDTTSDQKESRNQTKSKKYDL
jgi:hypothetical protein